MQQNCKCKLCENKDEIFYHIISECSKLVQKDSKSWYNWVGKVIHWEFCKKLKFDHLNKSNMYKLESIQKNETYKILWDFDMQTNHQSPARRANLEKKSELGFYHPSGGWQVETIQTTAWLKSLRILRRVLETRGGDLLSLRLIWRTIS